MYQGRLKIKIDGRFKGQPTFKDVPNIFEWIEMDFHLIVCTN